MKFKLSERTSKRRNNGKPWSKFDIERLMKLYSRNHDYYLARMFGRTPSAITCIGFRLGLKKEYDDEFKHLSTEPQRWTESEIKTLRKMYQTHTFEELSDVLDRSAGAINAKAKQLKLRKARLWAQEDDDILRKSFKQKTYIELSKVLNRSPEAIMGRAAKLGLDRKCDWWTDEELDLLIKHYPTMQTKELAKLIGRSAEKVRTKAFCLKIRKDPQSIIAAGKIWNKKESSEIFRLYKNHSAREIATILGYPYEPVRRLLSHHSPGKLKLWTKEEDEIIRKHYKNMTYIELAEKLGRTVKAVGGRVESLGLTGQSIWKSKQVQILKAEYKKGTDIAKIAKILGKSRNTCNHKITALGLRQSK